MSKRLRATAIVIGAAVPIVLSLAVGTGNAGAAAPTSGPRGLLAHAHGHGPQTLGTSDAGDDETEELMDRAEQYAAVRTAPGTQVAAGAFRAAQAAAQALPLAAGAWQELTNKPYNSDAINYRDPFWSNSSGGAGLVSGRMTAIATDGGTVYAGAADGGVWKSTDKGAHWKPIFDQQSRLSIGAIAINPADHSIWVGTGEANTAFENYAGDGIYRSANGGTTWSLVGNRLDNSLISRITFDGKGYVLVATSNGLVRRSALDLTAPWTVALKPDPNPDGSPYRTSWMSDVRVRPGTNGKYVVAVLGWRGGTLPDTYSYNGFYVSTAGGTPGSFSKVDSPPGISGLIGRVSLDYTADGSQLWAVIEAPDTVDLNGVYVSKSGTAAGPWNKRADNAKLDHAPNTATSDAGSQSWYDQYVTVDPKDAKHIYLGLKEVYESNDSGHTWTSIGPYWNFGKACWSSDPALDTCPKTTHPDQHAAFVAPDGTAYFATDGGMYSRPAALRTVVKWNDLNATLHSLQYYYAGIGRWPGGGDAIYGGLQDNGTSLLKPGAAQMVSPFGGDGGDVIVDPNNALRAVNEYVYLTMARTQNGGRSDGTTRSYTTITPTCASFITIEFDPHPCDPFPRFIAPYEADPKDINHWVAGGQMVWDNGGAGWSTVCNNDTCSWKPVHDLGAGAQTTAVGVSGKTIYAGWCGNGCNPGGSAPFISGIDTNANGGVWHRISAPNLPNRIPTSFYVDPANSNHVYVVYGAFSRRWIPGGGVGHVFESVNGGATWQDRSANLPDAPVNDVLIFHGNLVVGTDVGVFMTPADAPFEWSRVGTGLPNASSNDLAVAPGGTYIISATHGRGIWK
ncbi:MAG: glycosyl hydrolase, partial [Actinomycetota bacterium]|nr:glycosyl hydrolase [Actinomycetota bacterium]